MMTPEEMVRDRERVTGLVIRRTIRPLFVMAPVPAHPVVGASYWEVLEWYRDTKSLPGIM